MSKATSLCLSSSFFGKLSFIFFKIPASFCNNLSIVFDTSSSLVTKSTALFKSFINSFSNIGLIASLFEVNEFIVSSLFNILFLTSSSLKSFWTFSWNSLIASLMNFSINFSFPGSFNNSLAIKSAFFVIESELANFDLISNNFIKIF